MVILYEFQITQPSENVQLCSNAQIKFKLKVSLRGISTSVNLDLLVVLHANVARAWYQHDTHILQRAFHDVHVLVQVAGWRLGGIRQEGILEVHTQGLWQIVVPKCQAALTESERTYGTDDNEHLLLTKF